MTFKEFVEIAARYIWPLVLGAFIFLCGRVQQLERTVYEQRLHVAENYTSKNDLEKMFSDFERRMDKRLDHLVRAFNANPQ